MALSPWKTAKTRVRNTTNLKDRIDLSKKRYRLLTLFSFNLAFSFLFGLGLDSAHNLRDPLPITPSEATAPSNVTEENDEKDLEAKKGDEKFLEESEITKRNILRGSEIDSVTENRRKWAIKPYVVKKGETLAEIATRFHVSQDSIAGSSNIEPDSEIQPGQVLSIPNKQGLLYKLKKGDSLAKVADFYKVRIEEIISENHLTDPDLLSLGQKVFLPGAIIPEAKPQWIYPVASKTITSGYGWRKFPTHKFHEALDIKAHYETVRAARKGRVIFSGWMGGYGNAVVIEHDSEYKSLYAHNSKLYVKIGDYVATGKVISRSGCTGYCFGPHLHFEVIHNDKNINPLRVLHPKKNSSK